MTKRKEKKVTHSTPIRLLPQFMHIERIMFACSCTSGSVGALLSTSRRRRIYGTARAKCPSATVSARVRLAAAAAPFHEARCQSPLPACHHTRCGGAAAGAVAEVAAERKT